MCLHNIERYLFCVPPYLSPDSLYILTASGMLHTSGGSSQTRQGQFYRSPAAITELSSGPNKGVISTFRRTRPRYAAARYLGTNRTHLDGGANGYLMPKILYSRPSGNNQRKISSIIFLVTSDGFIHRGRRYGRSPQQQSCPLSAHRRAWCERSGTLFLAWQEGETEKGWGLGAE